MKIIFKSIIVIFLILIELSFNGFAQNISEIESQFRALHQNVLREKIYVHTDKSVYLTGEILWFKIYNLDAENHQPLNTSKVAYLEVLDGHNLPVMQSKVALGEARNGSGSVYLPISIPNGNYKLRAYTNWMKNFGADYYFEKMITIINPSKSADLSQNNVKPAYDIQFFPEGGNLVNGLTSKVAFKVAGRDGQGVNVNGAILNQQNDTIVRFSSLKFGIGNFIFKPNLQDNYHAVFYLAKEAKPIIKELPSINKQGYVIQLKDRGKQLELMVNSNLNTDHVYLLVHTRSVAELMQSSVVNNGTADFLIDKDLLRDGISHFTVFNSEKQPVCERLYFKQPAKQALITANPDQSQYETRKKVVVNLSATDRTGQPLRSNLSVSVYKIDSLQKTDPDNIVNSIWLTSELRGFVESPDYYFDEKNPSVIVAADNLMLTQGWRKFDQDAVLKSAKPSFYFVPEYAGHVITAKLINTLTNKPAQNITAYLSVPGKRVQLYNSKSDSLGILLFNTKDFYGPGEIVVQTNANKDSTYSIEILSPFSENYTENLTPAFNLNQAVANTLDSHSIDMQVQNVYSGEKFKQFYNAQIDSSAFFGKSYSRYNLDDYTRFPTMEEVLREYVKSVEVTKQQKHFHIKIIGEHSALYGDPIVILDGVPVFDIDKVMAIDPLKVKMLQLVNQRYYWQATEFEGILNLTTYKGDLANYEFDPKAVIIDYEGMQLERKFYSPVYENNQQLTSRIPDFRNVLYWSPAVSTNGNGQAKLTFYTSDRAGDYVGVVQGVTPSGNIGCQYFKFSVKQNYDASIR